MGYFTKVVQGITNITKWLAIITIIMMTLSITYIVMARFVGNPVIGDIELINFLMVLLIMFALAYTESIDSHISIGLIVDRFKPRVQAGFDLAAKLLTLIFCFLVSWAIMDKVNYLTVSTMLELPIYPFKIIIVIGFIAWGLEVLKGMITKSFKTYDNSTKKE